MVYRISAAYHPRKPLTPVQRASRYFAEEPRVLGKTLRRGISIDLTEAQFEGEKARLDPLIRDNIIVVTEVGEKSHDVAQEVKKPAPVTEPGYEEKRAQEEAARVAAQDEAKANVGMTPSADEITKQVEVDNQSAQSTKKGRRRG
jgi:hypothetical protein